MSIKSASLIVSLSIAFLTCAQSPQEEFARVLKEHENRVLVAGKIAKVSLKLLKSDTTFSRDDSHMIDWTIENYLVVVANYYDFIKESHQKVNKK